MFFRKNKKLIGLAFLGIIILSFILAPLPFVGGNIAHAQTTQGPQEPAACWTWTGGINPTECIKSLLSYVGGLVMTLSGIILGVSGLLLDSVLSYSVVNMTTNLRSLLEPGGGIYTTWTTLRDLANILFIFIILYIAIGTILRLDSINTKKLLVHVIIIALLLNFSLFFTKVIVDASNIIATSFHNDLIASGGANGFTGVFMKPLGMSSFYDGVGAAALLSSTNNTLAIMIISGMAFILFMITAFVFFAASIMFIARFVILIFLMILSPLAFIAMALPKDEYSKKWWNALIEQGLFAPVFLALLWVASALIRTVLAPVTSTFAGVGDKLTKGSAPTIDELSLFINFMVVIGSIIFALVAAKSIGGAGASGIMKWGSKFAKKTAGGLVTGTAGRMGNYIDKKIGGTQFGNTRIGGAIRAPFGGLGGMKIGGAKAGKQLSKENDARIKEHAAIGAKRDIKKAEDEAKERATEATANLTPRKEIFEKQFGRRSEAIGKGLGNLKGEIERDFISDINAIKTEEAGKIAEADRQYRAAQGLPGVNKAQVKEAWHAKRDKIRKEAGQATQRAKEVKEEKKADVENRAQKMTTGARKPLSDIEKKIKETQEKTLEQSKKEIITQKVKKLKEFKSFRVYKYDKARREAHAKFLAEGKTDSKTNWDKMLAEIKSEIGGDKKEEKGEKKGGGDKKDPGEGGGGGGGAHH